MLRQRHEELRHQHDHAGGRHVRCPRLLRRLDLDAAVATPRGAKVRPRRARDVPEMHPRSQPRYHARYTKIYIRAQRRLNLPDQLTSPVAAVAGRRCSRRVVSSARAARCRVSEAVASHANTRVVSHAALSLRARTGHRGGGGRAGRGGGAAAGRRCMRRAASPVTRGLVSSDGSACVRARAGMSSSLHIG